MSFRLVQIVKRSLGALPALLAGAVLCCPAAAAEEAKKDSAAQPTFGMALADADSMFADSERWEVAFRIATPSTCEIACRFDKTVQYNLRFLTGECCYIEKTASLPEAELKKVFDYYADELGTTEEATENSDKTQIFSRWKTEGRQVELSASRRSSGEYLLTYIEFHIEKDKLARRAQEEELELMRQAADAAAAAPAPAPQ